jgi:hypothetical protein
MMVPIFHDFQEKIRSQIHDASGIIAEVVLSLIDRIKGICMSLNMWLNMGLSRDIGLPSLLNALLKFCRRDNFHIDPLDNPSKLVTQATQS